MAEQVDLSSAEIRKEIIDEINGDENVSRKRFEQRKFDIYRNRQAQYVLERLVDEFGQKSTQFMRKVLSINPLPRIINEQASLYANEPERYFAPGTDQEKDLIARLYQYGKVDTAMRLANRYYKLHDQAFLYLVPKNGLLIPRAITPKDLDVIPDAHDPEKAYAYVMNVFNLDQNKTYIEQSSIPGGYGYYNTNTVNQKISDDSDRDALLDRYVFWTADFHFTTDGYGNVIGDYVENPIKRLPFIDISMEKDFQFFVRRGNAAAEFTIDLLTQMSDLANVARLQGYSQAIVYSADEPKDIRVGPSKVMWLKLDPAMPDARPNFVFESPSPDLNAGLDILNTQLKMFLSSIGLDATVVSGESNAKAFSSGVDHLLANLDKFQASKQDMDLFRCVEHELFDLMRDWSNVMQGVTDEQALAPEIKGPQLSENIQMTIQYTEPTSVQTKSEKEDSLIKLLEAGLITKKQALMDLFGYDETKAEEIISELNAPLATTDGDQVEATESYARQD
jgi:hypothetical protein